VAKRLAAVSNYSRPLAKVSADLDFLHLAQERFTLRSHILSVFSPAHDGAAVALSNAMFHLARYPEVWDKLRSEIMPTSNESLSYELVNSYQYLNWVLRESGLAPIIVDLTLSSC
jgi:cytochrome P450 monooxygenase